MVEKGERWLFTKFVTAASHELSIMVGFTDRPDISSSYEVSAFDIRVLADLLSPHQFRLAYTNRDWSSLPNSAKNAMDAHVKLLQEVYKDSATELKGSSILI